MDGWVGLQGQALAPAARTPLSYFADQPPSYPAVHPLLLLLATAVAECGLRLRGERGSPFLAARAGSSVCCQPRGERVVGQVAAVVWATEIGAAPKSSLAVRLSQACCSPSVMLHSWSVLYVWA